MGDNWRTGLFICLSICVFFYLSSFCLSICLPVYQSILFISSHRRQNQEPKSPTKRSQSCLRTSWHRWRALRVRIHRAKCRRRCKLQPDTSRCGGVLVRELELAGRSGAARVGHAK